MYVPAPDIIEKWLNGWSTSRNLPLPVPFRSGFKVDVGYDNQKTRYVFPELNEDCIALSENIDEPCVFLKICAAVDDVKKVISNKWTIQQQAYMMACFHSMNFQDVQLAAGYKMEIDIYNSVYVLKILTQNGEMASIGRVVMADDLAVYDRIETSKCHRRKGLARFLMKQLENIAVSKGVFKNFLVATEAGKLLYESLGWELYSLYTSAVISN